MVGFWDRRLGWDRKRPTGFSNTGYWVGLTDCSSEVGLAAEADWSGSGGGERKGT